MSKRSDNYDLGAIMRESWRIARASAIKSCTKARAHLAAAMKRSWADAKVSMAAKRLIGHTEPYEGRILKIVSIQAWRSKDGYDRRDYIQMEIDGIPKK